MSEPDALPKPPRRLPISLEASSSTPIVLGILLCAAGFVLIAFCWSQVALRMQVADQMAYVVSSGFTGMGLLIVGVIAVSIQVRRRDAEAQLRRLEQLVYAAAGRDAGRPSRARHGRSVTAKLKAIRDPVGAAMATSVLAVIAGFVLIAFSWYRVSGEMDVAVQVPYVVSGGIAGLALIALGSALSHVLVTRGLERERGDLIADVVGSVSRARR